MKVVQNCDLKFKQGKYYTAGIVTNESKWIEKNLVFKILQQNAQKH